MSARARHAAPAIFVAAALAAAAAPLSARTYWLHAFPTDAGEVSLRDVVTAIEGKGPAEVAAAYGQFAEAQEGSPAAGLAALAAGLALLDAGRHGDALPHLRRDEVEKTPLLDHALMARGRAYEVLQQPGDAIEAFLGASEAVPRSALACSALFRAAEVQKTQGRLDDAVETLKKGYERCDTQRARALLLLGLVHEQRKEIAAAAEQYRRVEDEHAASLQAVDAARRLAALRPRLPPEPAAVRTARELQRALAVFDAGREADAFPLLRALLPVVPAGEKALVSLRLGRCLIAMGKYREAATYLNAVSGSPYAAEAQYARGRLLSAQDRSPVAAYSAVVRDHPGTPWAQEALNSLALHFQKDARHDDALPYYRDLLAQFPAGPYADRAAWYAGWGDYRHGRYRAAAQALEAAARTRPPSSYTGAALYWAGRARLQLKEPAAAREDFAEAVLRYKHAYHGTRAAHALTSLAGPGGPVPPSVGLAPMPAADTNEIPEPNLQRLRALLLVDRLDEAHGELSALPRSPKVSATLSWIEWRRGRLRPAITWMKRAYPEHVSEAGDRLPDNVWRILYPLEHADALLTSALAEGLDPALVAALVCQESTFDADATSRVGARGLMQLMPSTARELARAIGLRAPSLLQPEPNLRLGARYLRQMVDRYDGRVERALAAYNAGPSRVRAWTAGRPGMSAEEFVETVPFQETRHYVMTILTSREEYRRIYRLDQRPATASR